MTNYRPENTCTECSCFVDYNIFKYSIDNYGLPLCRKCQDWIKQMTYQTTQETITLYFALKQRSVPAELEKFDGYKTIDIAVTEAKVNIEVDGQHHNFDPFQALSDLKRTYHAFKKGYLTLRIPNSLIRFHLDQTADLITEFLMENRDNKYYG